MSTLPPVGGDLLEQEAFQLLIILQEILQLRIGNTKLQRLDTMMLQRDQQMFCLVFQLHLNVRTEMEETEKVQFLLEFYFE